MHVILLGILYYTIMYVVIITFHYRNHINHITPLIIMHFRDTVKVLQFITYYNIWTVFDSDYRLHAILHRSGVFAQWRSGQLEDRVQPDALLRTTRNHAKVSARDCRNVPGWRFGAVRQVHHNIINL